MPASKPRFLRVAELIRKRILHGDYSFKSIPSERSLGAEFQVNYMTVRRGLEILMKDKLLVRQPNGRLKVNRRQIGTPTRATVGLLMPGFGSSALNYWRNALELCAGKLGYSVRATMYVHWDDPILSDVTNGLDGVFLLPEASEIPSEVVTRLKLPEKRVVVVGQDYSSMGVPSIDLFPPVCIQRLLDHFAKLGHSRIDCINTQPEDNCIKRRIDQWRLWMAVHRYEGKLFNDPVASYSTASTYAHEFARRLLKAKKIKGQALFCTTANVAMGVIRACVDQGIELGRELVVGTVDGEGIASLMNPSLTALEPSDPSPFLNYCLDWMLDGQKPWEGPLLLQPGEVPLKIRESSGHFV